MENEKISKKKIATVSSLNILGTFILKGIVFLSVPIFTRILSQNDYGVVSTYITYISFISIVIGLSMNTAIANARIDYKDKFIRFNATIIRFSFLVFVFELCIFNVLYSVIGKVFSLNRQFLNLILLIAYAEYIISSYYKINTIDFKYVSNLKISITNAILSLALSIGFISLMSDDVLARLLGNSLFLMVVSFFIFFKIAQLGNVRTKLEDMKRDVEYALSIAIPNIFHQISQIIMGQSDKVFILGLCGGADVAKYSAVYTFSTIIQMIWNAINEVWVPWLYRKLDAKEFKSINKYSRIYLWLFSFLTCVILLIASDFIWIIAPSSYSEAKDIIVPIILGTYFIFLYSFFANIEIFNKKNKYMAILTATVAIANIAGNALLIPIYGYKVAAYTTLMAYALLTALHYIFLTYLFKLNFYSMRMFVLPVTVTCISGVLSNIFLNTIMMRCLCVLMIVLGACFMLKKNNYLITNIKEIFKRW